MHIIIAEPRALALLGKQLSIATPINDDLVHRIKILEAGYHAS